MLRSEQVLGSHHCHQHGRRLSVAPLDGELGRPAPRAKGSVANLTKGAHGFLGGTGRSVRWDTPATVLDAQDAQRRRLRHEEAAPDHRTDRPMGGSGATPSPSRPKPARRWRLQALAVTVPSRKGGETVDATQWLNVTAFGRLADDLARHDNKGEMVADSLVSARDVRCRQPICGVPKVGSPRPFRSANGSSRG